MSALLIAAIVLACVFGGALFGMVLRGLLPAHHLSDETKDVVRLGTGLVATMAALVLGLLVASAKGSYDTQKNGLDEIAANLTLLDTVLQQYGPPAQEVRENLRRVVGGAIARLWPADASQEPTLGAAETTAAAKSLHAQLLALAPANDMQRTLQAQALQIATELARTRLLLVAQHESSDISGLFLVILTFWLVVLFASFGLFAPRNATVHRRPPDLRPLGLRRDLPHPGARPALRGPDPDLQHPAAQRLRASGRVAPPSATISPPLVGGGWGEGFARGSAPESRLRPQSLAPAGARPRP